MDLRGLLPFVIGLNVAALAVLYSRFADTDLGSHVRGQIENIIESLINVKSITKAATCGMLPVHDYIVLSSRVVLPNGMQPAASKELKTVYLNSGFFVLK
jgi:hypothetical protein